MNLTNKVVFKQDESRPVLYKHYWVTKDKRVLFPQDFELGHLERTLEFIKKNAINYYYYQASDRLQEIAMRMHSKALNKRQTTDSLYVFFIKNTTLYKELENEIQKRKNPPKPKAANPLKPPPIKKDVLRNTVSQSTAAKTNPLTKKKLPF